MPDFIVNLVARANGVTAWLMDILPCLGALGSILAVAAAILVRAAAVHDPAGFYHAVHPTADEIGAVTLAVAVLRAHFKHQENVAAIAAVAQPGAGANPSPSQSSAK